MALFTSQTLGEPPNNEYTDFIASLADVWKIWSFPCPFPSKQSLRVLIKTAKRLQQAKSDHVRRCPGTRPEKLDAFIWDRMPRKDFDRCFTFTCCWLGIAMLPDHISTGHASGGLAALPTHADGAEDALRNLITSFRSVGLSSAKVEAAIAYASQCISSRWVEYACGQEAMENLDINRRDSSWAVATLSNDIAEVTLPVIRRLWDASKPGLRHSQSQSRGKYSSDEDESSNSENMLFAWQEMARLQLASRRAQQLYEILQMDDPRTKNALLADLVDTLVTPAERAAVDRGFQISLAENLLNEGSRTVDILDGYMTVIQSLTDPLPGGSKLDESGVLLDRAARSIRKFLSSREDAARIVLLSLLDPQPGVAGRPPPSHDNFSGRISMAMYHHKNPHKASKPFEGHDLTDMSWTPEPIDALSTHRLNTERDSIGHITSIQDDDIFIKELESVLGERLLKSDQSTFHAEQRLLAMFRTQFDGDNGDNTKIQASDVMLSDMQQSLGWNERVKAQAYDGSYPKEWPDFQARIISKAFWSNLKTGNFKLPENIALAVAEYAQQFAQLSQNRILQWIPELGRVTVELAFKGRDTITLEITPAQAALIQAFDEPGNGEAGDVLLSVADLMSILDMPEAMVRESCHFWVGHYVLGIHADDPQHDTFYVVEDFSADSEQLAFDLEKAHQDALEAKIEDSDLMTQRQRLEEHAETYAAYIIAMITNRGAMPASDIMSTLNMLVPGGFAHDLNDLTALLQKMQNDGDLMTSGAGLWHIQSLEAMEE